MDKENKEKERELRRYHVKHRMEYYPLPLRWFKYFRYVAMVLNVVNCISVVIQYIQIAVSMNDPETIEAIYTAYPNFNAGMVTLIIIADLFITAYLLVLCLLVFFKMGTITKSAYKLIIVFLISFPIINGLRQFMGGCINMTLIPEVYTFSRIIGAAIAFTAFSGVWAIINYIYFSKRKSLFTEHPEIDDFIIDDGSVQLVHYDECPYCHTKTNGNSSFCESCGRNFTNSDNNRKE